MTQALKCWQNLFSLHNSDGLFVFLGKHKTYKVSGKLKHCYCQLHYYFTTRITGCQGSMVIQKAKYIMIVLRYEHESDTQQNILHEDII